MEKKKRIILIGRTAAGKTTLCQRMNHEDLSYHKTQTVQIFNDQMIDTPGEYLERRFLQGALMVTSADADLILLVQDATEDGTMFPPAYTSQFAKPSLGVVTKCDLATAEQVLEAEKHLTMAGAQKLFAVSSMTGQGVGDLIRYLDILWS